MQADKGDQTGYDIILEKHLNGKFVMKDMMEFFRERYPLPVYVLLLEHGLCFACLSHDGNGRELLACLDMWHSHTGPAIAWPRFSLCVAYLVCFYQVLLCTISVGQRNNSDDDRYTV